MIFSIFFHSFPSRYGVYSWWYHQAQNRAAGSTGKVTPWGRGWCADRWWYWWWFLGGLLQQVLPSSWSLMLLQQVWVAVGCRIWPLASSDLAACRPWQRLITSRCYRLLIKSLLIQLGATGCFPTVVRDVPVLLSPRYTSFAEHGLDILGESVDAHMLLWEANLATLVWKGSSVKTFFSGNSCQVLVHYSNEAAGVGGVSLLAQNFGPGSAVYISCYCLG